MKPRVVFQITGNVCWRALLAVPRRNGSVVADFQLTFLVPDEQQDQLRNFTLSRGMVYNVLRQFLYEQEEDESEPMYIDPASLSMFLTYQ